MTCEWILRQVSNSGDLLSRCARWCLIWSDSFFSGVRSFILLVFFCLASSKGVEPLSIRTESDTLPIGGIHSHLRQLDDQAYFLPFGLGIGFGLGLQAIIVDFKTVLNHLI